MYVNHIARVEFHDVMPVFRDKTLQAVADTVYVPDSVAVVKLKDHRADDVV